MIEMEELNRMPSKAYGDIVEKLRTNVYSKNRNAYTRNRKNLVATQKRLTRKLTSERSKQEKGDRAKVEKIGRILSYMNAVKPRPFELIEINSKVPGHSLESSTDLIENQINPKTLVKPLEKAPTPKPASPMTPSPNVNPEIRTIVSALQSDFYNTIHKLNKKQLEDVMKYLSDMYYNKGISLIGDEDYDRLRELLLRKFGESEILVAVGAEVVKAKVTLPYFMGSMDKIKPEKNNLSSWRLAYPGRVCISDKLDGISALIVKRNGKRALYTRGDGTIGQDITHMLPYIQIGDMPGIDSYAVRGELIVSKANYEKVHEGKRGARQMVAGLANLKTLTKERIQLMGYIDFVAYEVIVPESLTPTQQFALLDDHSSFSTAHHSSQNDISIEILSNVLIERKAGSKYEIDGIIVAHDAFYPRIKGNPEHAFAFKMAFADQQAVTEVLKIIWEASKDGYLKPTVNFEPVNIGGVTIQYATGFNAAFIHSSGLGPGAYVEIIRSGDVIPYIKEVKSAAPGGPQMPSVPWHWNATHVDAVLDNVADNPDVQKRALLYFAQTLDIGFCGEGNITKLYDSGIHTISQLVHVTEEELVRSKAFQKKSAEKLVNEIRAATAKATMIMWAVGSGIFGRGIGTKRLGPAFDIVDGGNSSTHISRVAALPGWSKESATGFVNNLPAFRRFMEDIGIKPKAVTPKAPTPKSGKFIGQTVLFTGFHPKDLAAYVEKEGGKVVDSWGSKVTLLVIKNSSVSNEKTKKATEAGVRIITGDDLLRM